MYRMRPTVSLCDCCRSCLPSGRLPSPASPAGDRARRGVIVAPQPRSKDSWDHPPGCSPEGGMGWQTPRGTRHGAIPHAEVTEGNASPRAPRFQ
jgi:hypothetical protein